MGGNTCGQPDFGVRMLRAMKRARKSRRGAGFVSSFPLVIVYFYEIRELSKGRVSVKDHFTRLVPERDQLLQGIHAPHKVLESPVSWFSQLETLA
jgi:hypothetical protein